MSSLEQIILVMPYIPIREYNIQLSDYTLEDYKLEITTEIKAFDSTFIVYPPYEFEPTTGELSGQFQCGTLRERGNYKNNEVELIIQDDLVQGNYNFEDQKLDSYVIITNNEPEPVEEISLYNVIDKTEGTDSSMSNFIYVDIMDKNSKAFESSRQIENMHLPEILYVDKDT